MMAKKSHIVLRGSKRAKDPTAKWASEIKPNRMIDVTINLAGPPLPSADEVMNLTPKELAKYSASKDDANQVAKSLKKYGLKVGKVDLLTRSMNVTGTAKQMEAAFKPRLCIMRSARQGEYVGREPGPLQIPAELKGLIKGVIGFDKRQMAKRHARGKKTAAVGGAGLAPLTPDDLEARYNFPAGDGQGQAIAIAEFGGGYFPDDTKAYCKKFGRSAPNVKATSVNAPVLSLSQILSLPKKQRNDELGASVEVMMDVEIVAGLCPGADISVYFATFDQQGWVELLNEVIAARPVALSISWGLAEDDPSWSQNAVDAINDRLNMARLLGITICTSSGDDGSGDQIDDGAAHVDFPSSSPFVLSVGGTMLQKSGSTGAPFGRRRSDRLRRQHGIRPAELAGCLGDGAQFGEHRWSRHPRRGSLGGGTTLRLDLRRSADAERWHERLDSLVGGADRPRQRSTAREQAAAVFDAAAVSEG